MKDTPHPAPGPSTQTLDEEALIRAAQSDPSLFQQVYTRWVTPVYQFAYARTGNRQDAEDLTSQIFLKAYQAWGRYKHKGRFAAWLFTITRNQINSHFRAKAASEVPLEDAPRRAVDPDVLGTVIHSDEITRLVELIEALPAEEQELIHLRYVAELKFSDIALVLGRKEEAVKKALYRLQDRLQAQLEESHE
jgi:RNA polymerase sigma-70 factor (ECF subfamily)